MNDLAELKDGWGQPDPPSRTAHFAARAALLRKIEASRAAAPAPRRPRRRGVRLGWLASGTAVTATMAAAIAVAITLGSTQPGQPAGPASDQLSGPQVLLNAAVVAQAQPAGTGAYWHVKQEIPMPTDDKPTQTYSSWIARDGTHYTMPDGYPGAVRDLALGFGAGSSWLTLEQLERLPTDPDALKAWMTDSYLHPTPRPGPIPADGGVPGEIPADEVPNVVAEGLTSLLWQVPAPPAVRSAALRALAAMPNVTNLGSTDGGQALRISFGQPPADKYPDGKLPPGAGQLTLIIDPETSTLLSSTTYQGTTKILDAVWTNDLPKIIPPPTK